MTVTMTMTMTATTTIYDHDHNRKHNHIKKNNNNLQPAHNNNRRTTTTTIQSGEAPFQQARSLHPTLESWIMLSHKQVTQPNPSYSALCRQDTTSPWSTDYGGNISCWNLKLMPAMKYIWVPGSVTSHQTNTGHEPNGSTKANVSINTVNSEMDTSGARFVPKADLTHDDHDTNSHMSDFPLQLPCECKCFRRTILHWSRSHKLRATSRGMFQVSNRYQVRPEWILGNCSVQWHTFKMYLQFLDLTKLFNWLHNEHEKLCTISAKGLEVLNQQREFLAATHQAIWGREAKPCEYLANTLARNDEP